MNGEEKILAMLEQIQGRLFSLEQMQDDLRELKTGQAVIEREVNNIKASQQMLSLNLNKIDRGHAVLEHGQKTILARMDTIEDHSIRIFALERAR